MIDHLTDTHTLPKHTTPLALPVLTTVAGTVGEKITRLIDSKLNEKALVDERLLG
jgi:hypothetical protein